MTEVNGVHLRRLVLLKDPLLEFHGWGLERVDGVTIYGCINTVNR